MLIACSTFRQKLQCWLSCLISTRVLNIKNLEISEFLMSQFMFIMSQQFTITLEQRFQASTIDLAVDN